MDILGPSLPKIFAENSGTFSQQRKKAIFVSSLIKMAFLCQNILMPSPQEIIRTRLKEILGPATPAAPNGLNVLAYLSFKNGSERYLAPGIIIDEDDVLKGTHGIEVKIYPLAREVYGQYSPLERRKEKKCTIDMDLWRPKDLEVTAYQKALSELAANGIDPPVKLPSIGYYLKDESVSDHIGYGLKETKIDGVQVIQEVRMNDIRPRYVGDQGQVLERVKFTVILCPEMCWVQP